MKKKILFCYPSMMIGGSTAALLSLLHNLDPEKYESDLQLFRKQGPLLDMIPEWVTILPEAELYKGARGRIIKLCKFVFTGYAFRYLQKKITGRYAGAVLAEYQARVLSRKNAKEYDYAIGGLEGWGDWYLAFGTRAKKKYGWIHSTFANTTGDPLAELPWLEQVDKVAFVTEPCRVAFTEQLPQMAQKSVTVENMIDSRMIHGRSLQTDVTDSHYQKFAGSEKFKIVTVCRLTIPVKGLDRIVSAAAQLKGEGFDFLWYIVGDGEDRAKLQGMIEEAEVGECVVLTGKRMNPYPFVAAADIMCMPSRYEGKPIAVTESMILETPPVVTEYLAAHAQIENGVEGIIAQNRDDSIVECVRACISNRKMLDDMCAVLRSREYGNTAYIREIEKMLFD